MKAIESIAGLAQLKFSAVFVLATVSGCGSYDKEEMQIGAYSYGDKTEKQCQSGTRSGGSGATDDESTKSGIRYNVRTASNYDPSVAHPLLMVYAPGGRSRKASERFSGLTRKATSAGFVVGYADSRRLSIPIMIELGTIPKLIAKKWCVDQNRIYLTGHSDGGTVSTALAFLEETKTMPAAIAPSAAAISGKEIAAYACPDPISVMVMHNAQDTYFPGLGSETAKWWVACNRCDRTPSEAAENGCISYSNCAEGVTTRYCERPGSHSDWPGINQSIIEFFGS